MAVDGARTPLFLLLIDAFAFWLRNQAIFWLLALPAAGLAAAMAWLVETNPNLSFLGHPWAWEFLFAMIYAMFLDRWIRESLLDDATTCEGVDAMRHAFVPARLLIFAIVFYLFAMALSWLQLQGIEASIARWGVPPGGAFRVATTLVVWLPHLLVWATTLAFLILLVPGWTADAPLSLRQAWAVSEPARPKLFRLVVGTALLSLMVHALTVWGLEALPRKPWVPATMAAAQRLADCLLLAIAGHVLAVLFQSLTDWHAPEPEERPFRHMRLRAKMPP
jgi:hypothetical protein